MVIKADVQFPFSIVAPGCVPVDARVYDQYPSIIDNAQLNDSTDTNFEKIGQRPHLYWMHNNGTSGTNLDRDLLRQQVTFCVENDPNYPNC